MLYVLCIGIGEATFAKAQVVNSIQNVGFTRSIISGKTVDFLDKILTPHPHNS